MRWHAVFYCSNESGGDGLAACNTGSCVVLVAAVMLVVVLTD